LIISTVKKGIVVSRKDVIEKIIGGVEITPIADLIGTLCGLIPSLIVGLIITIFFGISDGAKMFGFTCLLTMLLLIISYYEGSMTFFKPSLKLSRHISEWQHRRKEKAFPTREH